MTSNVIPAFGSDVVPQAGEPSEYTIQELERLLEMARSGEIQGIGIAFMYRDKACSFRFAGAVGSYGLAGAAHALALALTKETEA